MILDKFISQNDIEKRKQLIRDITDYKLNGHDLIRLQKILGYKSLVTHTDLLLHGRERC